MKLMTINGELELPADFSFEIELNNPFLSDEGDSSVPATIPATPKNLKVLENIHRVDRTNRFMKTVPATLMAGTIQKHGQLIIDTLSMSNGIAVSLAVENSDLYTQFKEKSIKEILSEKVRDEWNQDIPTLANYLINVYYNRQNEEDFTIFPVAVAPYEENETKIYQFNNERDGNSLKWQARTVHESDVSISVTDGYGLSPFLYLHRTIDIIFQEMGYEVSYNCLAEQPFSDIVLVNNCADTIVKGVIRYSDLVPSCTLSEFISFLFNKFGIHVRVNSTAKTVEVMMLQQILNNIPTIDISSIVEDSLDIIIEDSSRIILSSETSIDGSEPAAETFDQLIERYGYYVEVSESVFQDIVSNISTEFCDCLIMRKETGQFYELGRIIGTEIIVAKYIGTNYFRYDRNNSVNSQQLESTDVMPAVIYDNTPMIFIGDRLHLNTSYNNSENDLEQPIMIAWKNVIIAGNLYLTFGTTQKHFNGSQVKPFSLTTYDMYEYFWSNYNNLLLNRKTKLKGRVLFNSIHFASIDMTSLMMYRNQKLLPLKSVFEISDRLSSRNSEFLLVKNFTDATTDPPITPETQQRYRWTCFNTIAQSDKDYINSFYPKYFNGGFNYVGGGPDFSVIDYNNNLDPSLPDQAKIYYAIHCVGYDYDKLSEEEVYLGVPKSEKEVSAEYQFAVLLRAKERQYTVDFYGNITGDSDIPLYGTMTNEKETTVSCRYTAEII